MVVAVVIFAFVVAVVNTAEVAAGNKDPCEHPDCFFVAEIVAVADIVCSLFPQVVQLGAENIELVGVETIVTHPFLVVAECLC